MYRKLLESRPDNPQLMHLLGVAVFQQNRAEEAATLIQRAIERDPKPAEYHNNLGIVLDALRRSEESEASYRRAISIKPDYAEAHNNLAGTLLALGRCDQAIDEYQTAITLKPDYAEAWDNYGSSRASPIETTTPWRPMTRRSRFSRVLPIAITIAARCFWRWANSSQAGMISNGAGDARILATPIANLKSRCGMGRIYPARRFSFIPSRDLAIRFTSCVMPPCWPNAAGGSLSRRGRRWLRC